MHINHFRIGTTAPTALRLGITSVARAYLGSKLVYGEYDAYHTIYGENSPGDVVLYGDGVNIAVAASFYRNAQSDGWRVAGARLYVPPAALSSLPATATLFWWYADFDELATMSTRSYTESKVVTLAAGWNAVYWGAPYALAIGGVQRAWAGYTFGNGQYLVVNNAQPEEEIVASDGSSIQFANMGDGFMSRSAFTMPGNEDKESNNPYGIDIIFDEGT